MAKIKIYVGTYAKYNSGSIAGKWLALPMAGKNLYRELKKIAGAEKDPEYMIQDTDIPAGFDFRSISESENIFKLNEEVKTALFDFDSKKRSPEVQEAIEEYKKVWQDSDMREYSAGKISDIYKTAAGDLIEFEKLSIEKNFCFCADLNGVYCEETEKHASKMAYEVSRKEKYFRNENFRQFEDLEKALKYEDVYIQRVSFYGAPDLKLEKIYTGRRGWDFAEIKKNLILLSPEDVAGVKKVLKSEKAKFEKRLSAWWKRYGADGLHTWTYYSD
jgi:hypothetical protein